MKKYLGVALLLAVLSGVPCAAAAEPGVITMSTTTSTENSGLLDVLLPEFTKDTNFDVKVIAKGTGAAIRDGMDGNVDIIFVHALAREEAFVAEGYGTKRRGVMHNDFVILGPEEDPAGIGGMKDAVRALKKIAAAKARFVSRGDDSGTHTMEQALWQKTGLPMEKETLTIVKKRKKAEVTFQHPEGLGRWYLSIGQGMGKTLTYAEEREGYTLADRGTTIKYTYGRDQGLDLEILCEGDPALYNPYGIIPVNPEKFPHVNHEGAEALAAWLVSPKAQALIANYRILGNQAFYPDAVPDAK